MGHPALMRLREPSRHDQPDKQSKISLSACNFHVLPRRNNMGHAMADRVYLRRRTG